MRPLVAVLAALAIASIASAQTFEINDNGTIHSYTSGDDATIDLGTVTADRFVHIYDPSGADDNAGKITIRGSATGNAVVYVFVAGSTESQLSAFNDRATRISEGLRDLAGIEFVNPDDASDTSLRDHGAVAVSIVGDLTGYTSGSDTLAIVAGTLFRIDVRRYDPETEPIESHFGGRILGDLVSTMPDGAVYGSTFPPQDFPSIDVVLAGWQITGDVVATSTATFDVANLATWSTVRSVAVGPNQSSLGISGNILAEKGYIGEIFSTGQIGTSASAKSQIKAGVRIGRVSVAGTDPFLDPVLDKDIFADINASVQQVAVPTTLSTSSMSLLETAGDYEGDIFLHDVYGQVRTGADTGPDRAYRQGIFVGGDYSGNIHVEYSYEGADMIARSFRGTIAIGQTLFGSIVAVGHEESTDPNDGRIDSITVGHGTGTQPPRPGIHGILGPQKGMFPSPLNGYIGEGANAFAARERWYPPFFPAIPFPFEHSFDSVIRAYGSIGLCRVAAMSNSYTGDDFFGSAILPGLLRARIESPLIADLQVDLLEHGSVWSGTSYFVLPTAVGEELIPDDIADNYAVVGNCHIGCVGPGADLWLDPASTVEISGTFAGELHLPELDAGKTVWIGEGLVDFSHLDTDCFAVTPASVPNYRYGYFPLALGLYLEPTPRVVWGPELINEINQRLVDLEITNPLPADAVETQLVDDPTMSDRGAASYGRILIREPNGLRGQIIIDANNTGPQRDDTHWLGDIEIGTGESSETGDPNIPAAPEIIATTRATAIGDGSGEGPLYTALPGDFGGGAVGLVPFALHNKASDPVNPELGFEPVPALVDVYFNNTGIPFPGTELDPGLRNSIKLEFYGPLQQPLSATPLLIEYHPDGGAARDVTHFFTVTSLGARGLELTRSSDDSDQLYVGLYTARPASLYCGGLNSPVPVADFVYRFRIGADCNFNGIRDARDIELDPTLDLLPVDSEGNPVPNGVIDQCETCSWRPCYGICCPADYDGDGGVTGGDLGAFFSDYEQGLSCADVDGNGGVDGGDLGAFFAVYEVGGC